VSAVAVEHLCEVAGGRYARGALRMGTVRDRAVAKPARFVAERELSVDVARLRILEVNRRVRRRKRQMLEECDGEFADERADG
jgi:hypothetical protein